MKRLRTFISNWRAERQRTRELHEALENLTDPEFLDRALGIGSLR